MNQEKKTGHSLAERTAAAMNYTEDPFPQCKLCRHVGTTGEPALAAGKLVYECQLNPAVPFAVKALARCAHYKKKRKPPVRKPKAETIQDGGANPPAMDAAADAEALSDATGNQSVTGE